MKRYFLALVETYNYHIIYIRNIREFECYFHTLDESPKTKTKKKKKSMYNYEKIWYFVLIIYWHK